MIFSIDADASLAVLPFTETNLCLEDDPDDISALLIGTERISAMILQISLFAAFSTGGAVMANFSSPPCIPTKRFLEERG